MRIVIDVKNCVDLYGRFGQPTKEQVLEIMQGLSALMDGDEGFKLCRAKDGICLGNYDIKVEE